MTTLLLARHAESDWNVENRFQGVSDRPLTERGRTQAEHLADDLAAVPLDAIYTSPLRRARETAEIVARRRGLELTVDPDLREIDVGGWAGLARSEVASRYPKAFRRWTEGGEGWEDGESYTDMAARVIRAALAIAEAHPGDAHVLLVAHGGPIRALHAAAAAMDVHAYRRTYPVEPNARLSSVAVESGRITRIH